MSKRFLYVLSALLILLAACGKKEEPKTPVAAPVEPVLPPPEPAGVSAGTVNLGKAIDSDKKITSSGDTFAKADTIYVTVDTTGSGPATLKAKWTFHKGADMTVVKEDSQTIMPNGPATSEFHVSKPGGWPAGDYQVELWLDDKSIGAKHFTVK